MWAKRVLVSSALAVSSAASAEPARPEPATIGIERHFTSNALDGPIAIADWYTLLRGSLQHEWQVDGGHVRLAAEAQAAKYDTVAIEDDGAVALAVEAQKRLGPRTELRGTLTYRFSSDGDDLSLGAFAFGTRAPKHVLDGRVALGIDLGNDLALVLELGDQLEKSGRTRFEGDILPAQLLEPDRNRVELSAKLTRTNGPAAYGVSASAALVTVDELGSPPSALSLAEYTLRVEAAAKAPDDATLGFAVGAQWLRGAQGIYSDLRPTYRLVVSKPLQRGFEIRGTVFGRFETLDSDDPLASWLNRAELETSVRLGEKTRLGAGVFAELKENLLYENVERDRGFYAEASYEATRTVTIVLRVDVSDNFASVIDVRKRTTDAFLAMRAKL